MAERERVKAAIDASVERAAKLLDELPKGDVETRLTILIEGWGRALAAGLEELAIAVADLRREPSTDDASAQPPRATPPAKAADAASSDEEARGGGVRGEDELRAEAARSRQETAALREESSA